MPRVERVCLQCEKRFFHYTSNGPGKFCSRKCSAKYSVVDRLKDHWFKKGCTSLNKGKRLTTETKNKISIKLKNYYQNGGLMWNKGLKANEDERILRSTTAAHEAMRGKPA